MSEPSRNRGPLLLLAVALLAGAAFAFGPSLLDGDDQPEPEAPTATAASAGPSASERAFLRDVAASGQVDVTASDASILQAGRESCGALERTDATTVYLAAARTAGPGGVAITRAAAATLCPQHGAAVEAVADAVAP